MLEMKCLQSKAVLTSLFVGDQGKNTALPPTQSEMAPVPCALSCPPRPVLSPSPSSQMLSPAFLLRCHTLSQTPQQPEQT